MFHFLLLLALGLPGSARPESGLRIHPEEVRLSGATSRQSLLVGRIEDGRWLGRPRTPALWQARDAGIVEVRDGVAVPIGDGETRLTASVNGHAVSVPVRVSGYDRPVDFSFRNNVQPILAKAGCSSGACHGAAAGKNGFMLSLRGYDDHGDFLALTRQAFGRRIVPSDPGRSLLLTKPTGALPHKGGTRFDVDSPEYRVLSGWIAAGAPGPAESDPRIERIEVLPGKVTLAPGDQQPFLVQAYFDDGHVEDVTRWAKYTSANESVARVNEMGEVEVSGYGEGAITAWYLSRIAIATVTVPYDNPIDPAQFSKAPRRNFIDEMTLSKLEELRLPPSPRSSDSEFLRRVFIDTIGTLPTDADARRFLESNEAGKRDELIDSLLEREEFVDYWSYRWSDLLLVSSKNLPRSAMWSYYRWIREQVRSNVPWDALVRSIVTARGSTLRNGAGNFFMLHDEPRLMAETTSQAFLGMSINCAKCHNHPMEKWTNTQYYQMANLFARVRTKSGSADGENIIFAAPHGELIQPLTGKPQPPAPLDGESLPFESGVDRREHLADWLVSPENPYFGRAIANRIWANFMGIGLVESVDDMRATNPASNEPLLQSLAGYLAESSYDLKALMRVILRSETYQRSSTPLPGNREDGRFYSRYYPRRLMAEVLLDAFSQVTAVPTTFHVDLRNENRGLGEAYPAGLRALQLPDTKIASYFLKSFGSAAREQTCTCERTEDPSVAQALHLANGDTLNSKLTATGGLIDQLLESGKPAGEIVETLYLASLGRMPGSAEQERFTSVLQQTDPGQIRLVLEDAFWAVLTSREFLFNH
ncbi:MAG: DUF1553 domain-containing protein [Verrucomicrobia bacterium]|nr:DUF1553 domain-containing protein [Verrucomicrobiota bacterium]